VRIKREEKGGPRAGSRKKGLPVHWATKVPLPVPSRGKRSRPPWGALRVGACRRITISLKKIFRCCSKEKEKHSRFREQTGIPSRAREEEWGGFPVDPTLGRKEGPTRRLLLRDRQKKRRKGRGSRLRTENWRPGVVPVMEKTTCGSDRN